MAVATAKTSPADEEQQAREQAKEELTAIRQLVETNKLLNLGDGWYRSPRDQALRAAIARRALRASHLDPTNEDAAFYAALTVDSFYFLRGQERSHACTERVILECQRYLDRFRKTPVFENHTYTILQQIHGTYQALADLCGETDGWGDSSNRDLAYRYARVMLPAMAQVDVIELAHGYGVEMNAWADAHLLTEALFLLCPEEELDAQYQWWRKFWEKEIQPLKRDDLPSWEYPSLGYYVRKKDVQGLRQALTALAKKGSSASRWLWDGPVRARRYLRMADDPEWKTWTPTFVKEKGVYRFGKNECHAFFSRLCPPMPDVFECLQSPKFPAETTIQFPADAVQYGMSARYMRQQAPIQPLCVAQGRLWLCSPGLLKQDRGNLHKDFRLYTADMKEIENRSGKIAVELTQIEWPEHSADAKKNGEKPPPLIVRCAAVEKTRQGDRVWIGTCHHGVACFWQEAGEWRSRWYNGAAGLPGPSVFHIAPCIHQGKEKILLLTRKNDADVEVRDDVYLAVLDPAASQTTVLLDQTGKQQLYNRQLAAVWPDGCHVPVTLYDSELWPRLDFKDVKEYKGFVFDSWWFCGGRNVWLAGKNAQTGRPRIFTADNKMIGELSENLMPGAWQLKRSVATERMFYDDQTQFLAVWLPSSGDLQWEVMSSPEIGGCICSAGEDNAAWGIVPGWQMWNPVACIMAYRMPTRDRGDWARNDCWFGPMKSPDQYDVAALMVGPKEKLYITSGSGATYVVSPDQFQAAAKRDHRAYSTAEWRANNQRKAEQAGWTCVVRMQIAERQWSSALKTLDAVKDAGEQEKVSLYRGLVLMRQGKRELEAAKLYADLIDSPTSCPAAKVVAMLNHIKMLHLAGHWQEMLDEADRFCCMFPDLKPHGGQTHQLDWYMNDARAKLAAQKRSSPAHLPEKADSQ